MRGRSDQASLSLEFLPVCFEAHDLPLVRWARVRLSEHPKLITKERQMNSIEARLSAAQNSSCNFCFRGLQVGWRVSWDFRIWHLASVHPDASIRAQSEA